VEERHDNLNYVIEIKGHYKYHKNSECKMLNKGFKNFFMPEPVVYLEKNNPKLHKTIVEDVREWFEKNNYTIDRYIDGKITDSMLTKEFNDIFPKKYNIEKITLSSGSAENQFTWYASQKSSGHKELETEFDINTFKTQILKLLLQRNELCSGQALMGLSRYDYLIKKTDEEIEQKIIDAIQDGYLRNVKEVFLKNYTIPRLKDFWIIHKNIKEEVSSLLKNYFKWKNNFNENEFDKIFLENYNLKKCRSCCIN
jgi:hypothetical protein